MSSLPPPSDPLRPHLRAARAQADAGDLEGAERALEALLAEAGGPEATDRLHVLGSLMTVYSRTGRLYETLVLARELADRLRARAHLAEAAACLATASEALVGVRDVELRTRRLEELGRLLAGLSPDEALMAREAFHACAFELAIARGDRAAARRHAEHYRTLRSPTEGRPWLKALRIALMDVALDLDAGMPHRAREALLRARARVRDETEPLLPLRWLAVHCHDAAGDAPGAEAAALALLETLEAQRGRAWAAPARLEAATRLAGWLGARAGQEERARRAYDLAAAAVLERIAQLERAVALLPELGMEPEPAAGDLARLRRAFAAEQEELLRRVAALFRRQPDALARLRVSEGAEGEPIHLCAWCERVRTEQGTWLPVGHFLPRTGPLPISHGICGDCLAREQRRP